MDVNGIGAPGRKKVSWSLLRKAKQVFILLQNLCLLCMCVGTT